MLPLLMSPLAMAISLPIATLPGLYGIEFIIVVVFSMLSDVHVIIAADAGDKARAENTAAVIKIAFIERLPWNETGVLPAFEIRILLQQCFPEKTVFTCCNATIAAARS